MFGSTKKCLLTALASMAILGASSSLATAQDGRSRRDRFDRLGHGDREDRGSRRHERIDRLAARLEREARLLNREADSHFRGSPDYREFERNVDEIVRMADHIHDIAHRGGSLQHLRSDVVRLDRFYHLTERLFERMVAFRRLDRETAVHLRRALNAVERSIHELRDAIN